MAKLAVSADPAIKPGPAQVAHRGDRDLDNMATTERMEDVLESPELDRRSRTLLEPAMDDAILAKDDTERSRFEIKRDLRKERLVGLAVLEALLIAVKQAGGV